MTPLLDRFDRADTGPPPSTNWTIGMLNFTPNDGMKIVSNQALRGTTNADFDQGDYWNPNTFGPDCEVYVKVAAMSTSLSHAIRLWLRLTTIAAATTNGYFCAFGVSGAVNNCSLSKVTNATGTAVPGGNFTLTYGVGDIIGVRVVGSTLSAWKNGVMVASVNDTTYSSAGNIGLSIAATSFVVDDFGGGSIGAPNLLNSYNAVQYGNVSTDDGDYFVEYGSTYIIQQFKSQDTNSTDTPTFTWKGRSTIDTTRSPILIQIYNVSTLAWETLATVNSVPADTDFQVSVSQTTNLANYYDSTNSVTFRSYQQVI